jgi:hypothetical protein
LTIVRSEGLAEARPRLAVLRRTWPLVLGLALVAVLVRGEHIGLVILYPVVLAPLWRARSTALSFDLSKALNIAAMPGRSPRSRTATTRPNTSRSSSPAAPAPRAVMATIDVYTTYDQTKGCVFQARSIVGQGS